MKYIQINNLCVEYKGCVAVSDISFSVMRGEIVGLLGPNGAGKTTTMKVLATLKRPTSGSVSMLGFDVKREPEKVRPHICYVSQQNAMDTNLNVFDNLHFFAKLEKIHYKLLMKKIEDLLYIFGLHEKRKSKISTLSGGQYRRLQLARLFLSDSVIYLLDEPTLGFDVKAKDILWNLLAQICKEEGKSIVIATNDLTEAQRLCNRIAFINDGKLVKIDDLIALQESLEKLIIEVEFKEAVSASIVHCYFQQGNISLVKKNEVKIECKENSSNENLTNVLRWLENFGVIKTFNMRRPNLEDVFLFLTQNNQRINDSDKKSFAGSMARVES